MADKPVLLERDAELMRLGGLLDRARAGRGSVVAIEGPAGIGKTGLLAATREQAGGRGFRVLARGREMETEMAWPRCTACTGCASTWPAARRCCWP
jgi:ABC-type cobalamin transport system ATPase subunit